MSAQLAAELHLRAARHRLVEIDVLAGEIDRVGLELDLVVKLVVEVQRAERQPIPPKSLLKACFPRAILFRFEVRIRQYGKCSRYSKRLLKARLLDALGVSST